MRKILWRRSGDDCRVISTYTLVGERFATERRADHVNADLSIQHNRLAPFASPMTTTFLSSSQEYLFDWLPMFGNSYVAWVILHMPTHIPGQTSLLQIVIAISVSSRSSSFLQQVRADGLTFPLLCL